MRQQDTVSSQNVYFYKSEKSTLLSSSLTKVKVLYCLKFNYEIYKYTQIFLVFIDSSIVF